MKTFLNDKFWDKDWNIQKDYEAKQKKKENDAEVRAGIMVQILEDNQDNTQLLEKKYYEAYTLKDALELIKLLTNKNK
jgi:PHD/YefM family antitoxin component YafN of YafNO toxin-antitoxin module